MKSALVFVTLLSCIFSKYESQLNEEKITASEIKYPDKCTTFPKDTTFDIVYSKAEKAKGGKATVTFTNTDVDAQCTFDETKGTCTTQKDVPSTVNDFKINGNEISFTVEEEDIKIDISGVNVPPTKYNKDYVPLSSSVKTYQNFTFDANNSEAFAADKGIKIDFEKELPSTLKVYKVKDDKTTVLAECALTENKKTLQCPLNTTVFPLNSDNKTEANYTIKVDNVCGDPYEKNITVGVKWGSSHYVKALGLLSLLLVFIL